MWCMHTIELLYSLKEQNYKICKKMGIAKDIRELGQSQKETCFLSFLVSLRSFLNFV